MIIKKENIYKVTTYLLLAAAKKVLHHWRLQDDPIDSIERNPVKVSKGTVAMIALSQTRVPAILFLKMWT